MASIKVLVLLSSYNGDRYIGQQIDSILQQKDVEVSILIRDDGSKDKTKAIIREYTQKFPEKIFFLDEGNVGVIESFRILIKIAAERHAGFDYYAFSDQDDIWMEDKLKAGADAMDKASETYKLYYCEPLMVDENLTAIGRDRRLANIKGTLGESFIIAPTLGCTMIFSNSLLMCLSKITDTNMSCIHDGFAYRTALALGANITHDLTPHIFYRQHSNNAIGGRQTFIKRWKRRAKFFFSGESTKSISAQQILDKLDGQIPPREKKVLTLVSTYRNSFISKIQLIFSHDISSAKRLHNFLFRCAVLFNKV